MYGEAARLFPDNLAAIFSSSCGFLRVFLFRIAVKLILHLS